MFRVITKIPAHKRFGNAQSKLNNVRYYAKKNELCPPEVPKGGSSGISYTLGALALVTGATIGYAKYDEDFRKWLKDTAPFTDDVIKFVCQEDKSYYESVMSLFESPPPKSTGTIKPQVTRKSVTVAEKTVDYKAPAPVFPKIAEEKKPAEDYTEIRMEKKLEGAVEPLVEIAGDVKKQEIPKLPLAIIAELEEKMSKDTTIAIQAYNKSVTALKNYNSDIEIIVEDSVERIDPSVWDNIKQRSAAKEEAIDSANKHFKAVLASIKKLKEMLKTELDVPQVLKERTKVNIEKVQRDLLEAKKELDTELKNTSVAEKYWRKVEEARKHFHTELESLFPKVNFEEKDVSISGADMDLFVLHAVNQVLYYQKEMQRLETVAKQRLDAAIDEATHSGSIAALEREKICQQLEKEKRNLEEEFKKKCLKLRQESESELRTQLKLQSETFSDHLADAVKTREKEMERLLNRKFDEQLSEERCKYKLKVSAMTGRMRGLEDALKARADADKTAQQSQVLWSACQALFKAVKVGCPGVPWLEQIKPLKDEILAVKNASGETDELVNAVVDGIPKEAKERGVYPEDALRERFLKVEKVARALALLPEQGGRLHIYLLSYLQSFLLLNATNPITQNELNDEIVDFSILNTNEILQRARYWLDRGDFAQTLKYMNLLKGAPRSIAKQWMNETRILLETQQAANTLMSYAAASGLMYL